MLSVSFGREWAKSPDAGPFRSDNTCPLPPRDRDPLTTRPPELPGGVAAVESDLDPPHRAHDDDDLSRAGIAVRAAQAGCLQPATSEATEPLRGARPNIGDEVTEAVDIENFTAFLNNAWPAR